MNVRKFAQRLLFLLSNTEAGIAVIAFAVISALLIGDVLLREVFNSYIFGAQRISVYAMIIAGFLGIGLAADQGKHLRPTVADALIPERYEHLATRLGVAIMAVVFFILVWIGIEFVAAAIHYGDLARSIKIPVWTVQVIVPYAFFSAGLRYSIFAVFPDLNPEAPAST
ncbi:TRAP transporter small permease subunit [Ruegeria pomeroyi]|nr:TRAP transporter small permease subunit [Ruegeria pomeroyi]